MKTLKVNKSKSVIVVISVICFAVFLLLSSSSVFAAEDGKPAESDDLLQARIIKITRMSQPWKNQNVELRMLDSKVHVGRFMVIQDGAFQIRTNGKPKTVPFALVETVVLKRKNQDLVLVALASIGVGGLIVAGAKLGFDADGKDVAIAGVTGSLIGFTLGWKNFYHDVSISIK